LQQNAAKRHQGAAGRSEVTHRVAWCSRLQPGKWQSVETWTGNQPSPMAISERNWWRSTITNNKGQPSAKRDENHYNLGTAGAIWCSRVSDMAPRTAKDPLRHTTKYIRDLMRCAPMIVIYKNISGWSTDCELCSRGAGEYTIDRQMMMDGHISAASARMEFTCGLCF
jgi:hypothetical protein